MPPGSDGETRTRSREPVVGLTPSAALVPVLSDLFRSVRVLDPTVTDEGVTAMPAAGDMAESRPISPGLLALNGIDAARSFVAEAFLASASPACAGEGLDGALAVLRDDALAGAGPGGERLPERPADDLDADAFFLAI